MLTAYIEAAMVRATYENLTEDGVFYGEIPDLPGVWASVSTLEELPTALQDALEGWIALGLYLGHPIPHIDGQAVLVASVTWRRLLGQFTIAPSIPMHKE